MDEPWVVMATMFDGGMLIFGPFDTDEKGVEFAHTCLNDEVTETEDYARAADAVGIEPPGEEAIFVRDYTITRCFTDLAQGRQYLLDRSQ